jgi:hypothetical protein
MSEGWQARTHPEELANLRASFSSISLAFPVGKRMRAAHSRSRPHYIDILFYN